MHRNGPLPQVFECMQSSIEDIYTPHEQVTEGHGIKHFLIWNAEYVSNIFQSSSRITHW